MAEISSDTVRYQQDLINMFTSVHTDLVAIKSAVDTLATKLNADAGVTDDDYAGAAALVTTVP